MPSSDGISISFIIMNSKKIVLFLVGIVLLAILVWPRGQYKIHEIESGNVVILDNGTYVHLIGIDDTAESFEYLQDHCEGVSITLLPDSSSPFNPNHLTGTETVYAYVIQNDDVQCINSTIIRLKLSPLVESSYLKDSLRDYRKYIAL